GGGAGGSGGHHRLRIEADGVLLADVDQPVEDVSVRTCDDGGPAEVVVRTSGGPADSAVTARAKTVTVSGADFRYRADAAMTGPVRRRTWTLRPGAWTLTLPR
ncbi:diacylglycerol kinase, partial [Streptomyces sp. MB09-01]|nr:diacylglycerol kinase [Streptomyces sp. MB09-01]